MTRLVATPKAYLFLLSVAFCGALHAQAPKTAGTQVFTFLPWTLFFGAPGQAVNAVLMGAGWVINLAVAEVVIRRRARRRAPLS